MGPQWTRLPRTATQLFGNAATGVVDAAISQGVIERGVRGDLRLTPESNVDIGQVHISERGKLRVDMGQQSFTIQRDDARKFPGLREGDTVKIQMPRGRQRFARIVDCIERKSEPIVGRVVQIRGDKVVVVAEAPYMLDTILADLRKIDPPAVGEVVQVMLDHDSVRDRPAGYVTQIGAEVLRLEERERAVIDHYGLTYDPLELTDEEVGLLDARMQDECVSPHRVDLRNVAFVTIDGSTAKDFDDALFAKVTDYGYEVQVAIADVSAFVEPGSRIDDDAVARGTSVYLPGKVLPMLPHRLSR